MTNPVLVEVLRGTRVESRHRGAVAVADARGHLAFAIGDIETPVFPRSAIKAWQALPLVERGLDTRYGLGDEELALICASHSGEPGHVAGVERILAKAKLDASALRCGVHWPLSQSATVALARGGGTATALHNNCSGKHAGFLCLACALPAGTADYFKPEHPVQRAVCEVISDLTGDTLGDTNRAIDGCSVPTWAVPLGKLAQGFAKFGTGIGVSPARAAAARRLREACAAKPWYVAGTGRLCTEMMQRFGRRVFVKTGAEGVYCGALPDQGLGFALKCDDGAGRAAQALTSALVARFLPADEGEREALLEFNAPVLKNWNGYDVGAIRVAEALSRAS